MAVLLLAVQLAVGGALFAGSLRAVGNREASRELLRVVPVAAAVAVVLELASRTTGVSSALLGLVGDAPWAYLVGGLATVPGCHLVVAAGRAEARGDLGRSRRAVRVGGFLMAAGAIVQGISNLVMLIAVGISAPGAFALSGSLTCVTAAGCAGLLAGLSGKPRPTGYLAAVLVVAGAVAWLAAR